MKIGHPCANVVVFVAAGVLIGALTQPASAADDASDPLLAPVAVVTTAEDQAAALARETTSAGKASNVTCQLAPYKFAVVLAEVHYQAYVYDAHAASIAECVSLEPDFVYGVETVVNIEVLDPAGSWDVLGDAEPQGCYTAGQALVFARCTLVWENLLDSDFSPSTFSGWIRARFEVYAAGHLKLMRYDGPHYLTQFQVAELPPDRDNRRYP